MVAAEDANELMPRRKQPDRGVGAWLQNQLYNTSVVWLIGAFAIGLGFYFKTLHALDQHAASIKTLQGTLADTKKEDSAERAKAREAFLADSKASALGIAELNKQTAVMNAVLVSLQRELEKIGQKLESAPRRAP